MIIVEYTENEYFDAQFCPTKSDIRKAVKKFLEKHLENKPPMSKGAIETFTKQIIDGGGVTIKSNDTSDFMSIMFKKL